MTSAREKFFFTRTLCCLLKSLEGLQTEIELRNDAHLKGIVERVESSMGVTMVNCELIVGGRMRKLQQMFVQGRKIRMVAIPDDVDMISAMLNVISMFDSSRIKGRNEFKKQPRVRGRGSSVRSRGVPGRGDALSRGRGRARGNQDQDVHVDIVPRGRGFAGPALKKSSVADSSITPQVKLHVSAKRVWTKSIQQTGLCSGNESDGMKPTDSCSGNERDTVHHKKTSERVFALGESNNSNINVQSRLLKLSGSMETPIVAQAKQTVESSSSSPKQRRVKCNLLQSSGSDSRSLSSSFRTYQDSHHKKTDRKEPQKKDKHSCDRDKSSETERGTKDRSKRHDERKKSVATEERRSLRHSDREESVPTKERRSKRDRDKEKSVPTEERIPKRDSDREESVPTKERSKRDSDREKSFPSEERRSERHSDKVKSSPAEKEGRLHRHGGPKKSRETDESRLTSVSRMHHQEELLKSSVNSERYSRFQGVVQQESSSSTGLRHDNRYPADPTIFHSSTSEEHRREAKALSLVRHRHTLDISPSVSHSNAEHGNENRHDQVKQPESIRPPSKSARQRLGVQDLRELIAHRHSRGHGNDDDDQDDI